MGECAACYEGRSARYCGDDGAVLTQAGHPGGTLFGLDIGGAVGTVVESVDYLYLLRRD